MNLKPTSLKDAETNYEEACIALKHAVDSRGLKIMLGPIGKPTDRCDIFRYDMPSARDYAIYLRTFLMPVNSDQVVVFNEANFATNVRLLADAYEAAAWYEELQKDAKTL